MPLGAGQEFHRLKLLLGSKDPLDVTLNVDW